MIDVLHSSRPPVEQAAFPTPADGPRSRLVLDLRELATDLVGRPDRGELTWDEELALAEALDAAVDAVLTRVGRLLEAELAPRVEAMPVHARVNLAGARRRRELGID